MCSITGTARIPPSFLHFIKHIYTTILLKYCLTHNAPPEITPKCSLEVDRPCMLQHLPTTHWLRSWTTSTHHPGAGLPNSRGKGQWPSQQTMSYHHQYPQGSPRLQHVDSNPNHLHLPPGNQDALWALIAFVTKLYHPSL